MNSDRDLPLGAPPAVLEIPASELPPELLSPLPAHRKLALGFEILRVYVAVRWRLALAEPAVVIRSLRAHPATVPAPEPGSVTLVSAARLASAVHQTMRFLPTDSRCLMRSLVLIAILGRRSISASLIIGVREDGDFAAHAWVEYGGVAILPDGAGIYQRLAEL